MKNLVLPNPKHPAFIAVGALFVVLILFWGLVQLLVNKDDFTAELFAGIKQVTGYEAHARSTTLSVFPYPKVIIERLQIDNLPTASTESIFTSQRVDVSLDMMALLTGEVKAGTITMVRPVVELEVFKDKTANWDFLDHFRLSDLSFVSPRRLAIEGGSVNINNSFSGQMRQFEAINFLAAFNAASQDMDIDLSFSVLNKLVELQATLEAKAFSSLSQYNFGLDLGIHEGKNHLVYKGEVGHGHDGFSYDGVFTLDFVDIVPWVEMFFSKEASAGIFQNLAHPVPLQLSGKAKADGSKYALTQITLKSKDTSGTGQVVSDDNVFPQTQAAFNFTGLDASAIIDPKHPVSDDAFNSFFVQFLPDNASGSIDIRADEFRVGRVKSHDARFMATIDGGEMVINQAAIHLPGETELLLFGIVKRSMDNAIHFDGSVELLGHKMLELAHALGFNKDRFITDQDGEFRAKASIFFSRANSVVSDFKFQAGTLLASGGMTSSQDGEVDSEFTLRVSGIKLDPFAALVVPGSHKDSQKSDFEDILRRLDWLDAVKDRIRLNLVLQNYTLSKTEGRQSALHILLEPGKFSLWDSEFELGDIVFSGAFSYDQQEEFPMIKADMSVSSFNIEPYTAHNLRKSPVPRDNYKPVWSEDFFSFSWLKGYNSNLDIRFKKLIHPDFPMQNVRLVSTSSNGKWDIKSFKGNLWDGDIQINGALDVTSIPALSIGFSLEDIESVRLFEAFAGHTNFLGKLSLNGQISTSGINMLNWVQNARGTFVALGQNLVVKGFDVSSLVQAIPSVRTVADVVNTARVSMLRRYTSFSVVEGSFYLDNGVFRSSELKLRAKHSIGVVNGSMDMTTWMMDCGLDFGLITLSRGDYPTISLHFSNSIDDPEIVLDTRSLESWIARKYLRPVN